MSNIESLVDMERDIISHPAEDLDYLKDIFESEIFSQAEIDDINSAFKIILGDELLSDGKKLNITENLWKVNFTQRPPSPEEFLTPQWIGETATSLYPYIKEAFIKFFDPTKPYRYLYEYWSIGGGKSTLVALIKGYIAVVDYYLRNLKQFFKLAPTTLLCDCTISLSLDMAYDLNIVPMLGYMGTSTKFCRVKQEDQLVKKMREDPSTIYYTTACKGGSIFRIGDLFYRTISEPSQLLGLSTQAISLTELAFMQEKGMKSETVMRLLNDSKERIHSRFGNHYLARLILDSSPNTLENPVDRHIYYESDNDPKILKLSGPKWTLQPWLFPVFEKTGETFPVYKGNVSKQPKILESIDLNQYDITDILQVPIDALQLAKDSLPSFLKNYGGIPAGSDAKLITNQDIIERLFTPSLKNFYAFHNAPADKPPEGLLWDLVKKEFFVYSGQGNLYEFYRLPYIDRFVSIDLAKTHDMATVAMSHIEKNIHGEKMYIVDFSLAIMSTKVEINMDAFKHLLLDMTKYGHITIVKASYDGFQSDTSRQALIRHNIDTIRVSVDLNPEYYYSFISYASQNRVKMGRNLIMKNNMKSLINQKMANGKSKVEHEKGEWCDLTNHNWELSRMGYFGKDLSDAVVASITLADLYGTDTADYVWHEEDELKNAITPMDNALKDIKTKYNMKIRTNAHYNT